MYDLRLAKKATFLFLKLKLRSKLQLNPPFTAWLKPGVRTGDEFGI